MQLKGLLANPLALRAFALGVVTLMVVSGSMLCILRWCCCGGRSRKQPPNDSQKKSTRNEVARAMFPLMPLLQRPVAPAPAPTPKLMVERTKPSAFRMGDDDGPAPHLELRACLCEEIEPGALVEIRVGWRLRIPKGYIGVVSPAFDLWQLGVDVFPMVLQAGWSDVSLPVRNTSVKNVQVQADKIIGMVHLRNVAKFQVEEHTTSVTKKRTKTTPPKTTAPKPPSPTLQAALAKSIIERVRATSRYYASRLKIE